MTKEDMRKLAIDWGDLELAFDNSFFEFSHYLDTETGEVLVVTEDARRELEQIYEEFYDPDHPEAFKLEDVLSQVNLPEWQKNDVRTADFVEGHYGSRVIAVPDRPTYEAYNEMQDFIYTITNSRLQERLLHATRGRGAFGRFKAILGQYPAELDRWFAFEEEQEQKRILAWLESHAIVPAEISQEAKNKNKHRRAVAFAAQNAR